MNALLAALLVATSTLPSTRITAAARAEARGSSLVGLYGHGGVEVTPSAKLHGRYGTLLVDASYAPRLLLAFPTGANPYQMGRMTLAYSPREEHQLSFDQHLEYGYSDFSFRTPEQLNERELRAALSPRPRAVDNYLESNTDLTYWARLSPRLTGSVSAGYSMSGGRSAASQVDVPFQRTPYAGIKATLATSDIDVLTSSANFERTELTNANIFSVIRMAEEWQHTFWGGTKSFVSGGIAAMRTNLEPYRAFPLARVGVSQDAALGRRRVSLLTYGKLTPWVNPLTGLLVRRGELGASASLPVSEELRLRAFGAAGWAVFASKSERERAFAFGADAQYQLAHDFSVYSGAIVQNQFHPAYPHLPRVHWTVSGGLRWQMDDRFGAHF